MAILWRNSFAQFGQVYAWLRPGTPSGLRIDLPHALADRVGDIMKRVCALPFAIPRKRTDVIIGIRHVGQLKRLGPFLILLLGFSPTSSLHSGMPFVRRDLPGAEKGRAETRWIAPYVLASSYSVGGKFIHTVRWFDENGIMTRELSGPTLDARSDYIYERGLAAEMIIHEVRGRWKIVLPKKSGPAGYITGVGDIFVHQFHPVENQIAADIYSSGKLVGTIGPFLQFKGRGISLAPDGSSALQTWKTASKDSVQIVVIGANGSVKFQADCDENVSALCPVGGGKGVLARIDSGEEPPVRFWYFEPGSAGKQHAIGPNAHPLTSTSADSKVLFLTSIGETERFTFMDVATGQVKWEIPSPVEYFGGIISAATISGDKVLFLGRDFAAIDLETGKLIARWQPNVYRAERGEFARRGDRLFLVTREKFVEMNLSDIQKKRNGWH